MNPDSSPFMPDRPISAELFTGHREQIEELLAMVRRARKKQLQVGWISGERGIGKSSLAAFVGYLAERDEQAIVAHVHLGTAGKVKDLVRESYVQILKNNENRSWGKPIWKGFEERIERVGLWGMDIKFKATSKDLTAAAGTFSKTLGHTVQTAGKDRKLLLLILDDVNDLANSPGFSNWIKSMVDDEATSGQKNPVCLIFVGLKEQLRKMKKNNASVGKVFQPLIDVKPWALEESKDFFRRAFEKSKVTIGEKEISLLAHYSGGLPVGAHEIGQAVWEIAKDRKIRTRDVKQGVRTATERFGGRYLKSGVSEALRSKKYRGILEKMTKGFKLSRMEFSKKQLLALPLTDDERNNVTNFLNRMGTLGAMVSGKESKRGVYLFPPMHRMYLTANLSSKTHRTKR